MKVVRLSSGAFACLLVIAFQTSALAQLSHGFTLKAPAGAQEAERSISLPLKAIEYHPSTSASAKAAAADSPIMAASRTIPLWTETTASPFGSFTYTMVGKDPTVFLGTAQASTIKSPVLPIVFTFSATGDVYDPTATDPCSPAGTPYNLTLGSPIFKAHKYVVGGTLVGSTQYTDFFQRANFFAFTKPTGLNPKYHVKVTSVTKAGIAVTASGFPEISGGCGNLGLIEINAWDGFVQSALFPALAAAGVTPKTLPIFLFHNVVLYIGTPSQCCVLGYHSAFNNPSFSGSPFQTYAVADYDTTGDFGTGLQDVSALSHEVGEWMDDPDGGNPTPPWGHIGQVGGCQNNLEVGDPLSGTLVNVAINGFTYHPQEMAFLSWFYDEPSIGVNGWFSSNGTFRTFAVEPCH